MMRAHVPRCVLMSAMPGAGKTHLAKALEERGFTRLCPDEEMFRRYGRYGYDFPRGEFKVREAPVLKDLAVELRELLVAGEDVVFDHGWWTPKERTEWRTLVIQAGGEPLMVYLPTSHDVRWGRIQKRNANAHTDANSIEFSESDLIRYAERFIPPGDDEPHLVYDGATETVLSALRSERHSETGGHAP